MAAISMQVHDTDCHSSSEKTVDSNIQLRIATRIHFALLRHYREDVAIRTLLSGENEAREALWVCQASGNDELVTLARHFDVANRAAKRSTPPPVSQATPEGPATAAQDLSWSQNTSGFGLTRPHELSEAPAAAKPTRWLSPSSWLRRTAAI
jgi:hypothetical protein